MAGIRWFRHSEDKRGFLLGTAWCLALFAFDVAEGPTPQVVGQTAVAPMLAGVLAGPRAVLAAGFVALVTTAVHGFMFGFGVTPSQGLRLAVVLVATLVGAATAMTRQRGAERLARVSAVAEAAQAAILRPRPVSDEAPIAVRYQSAEHGARVGGDAYEVQETGYGLRILLADARGKGLPAVRLAAAALGAFREAAHRYPSLSDVALAIDATVRREGVDEDFVTAVLAEYLDGELRLVNCGHPDPLLMTREGIAVVESPVRSEPLGLVEFLPKQWQQQVSPGDVLLLYTDGVIEKRDEGGAVFDLPAALQGVQRHDLDELLDHVLRRLREHGPGARPDDVALVAVKAG